MAEIAYAEIEQQLAAAIERQADVAHKFYRIAKERGETELAYKVAFAKARLAAREDQSRKITTDIAEDEATVATEDERMAWVVAEATFDAARQTLNSLRSQIDGLRTILVSHRDST